MDFRTLADMPPPPPPGQWAAAVGLGLVALAVWAWVLWGPPRHREAVKK